MTSAGALGMVGRGRQAAAVDQALEASIFKVILPAAKPRPIYLHQPLDGHSLRFAGWPRRHPLNNLVSPLRLFEAIRPYRLTELLPDSWLTRSRRLEGVCSASGSRILLRRDPDHLHLLITWIVSTWPNRPSLCNPAPEAEIGRISQRNQPEPLSVPHPASRERGWFASLTDQNPPSVTSVTRDRQRQEGFLPRLHAPSGNCLLRTRIGDSLRARQASTC